MKSFKQLMDERCWPGYKPAPGKKAYAKGSCVREEREGGAGGADNPVFTKPKMMKLKKEEYEADENEKYWSGIKLDRQLRLTECNIMW